EAQRSNDRAKPLRQLRLAADGHAGQQGQPDGGLLLGFGYLHRLAAQQVIRRAAAAGPALAARCAGWPHSALAAARRRCWQRSARLVAAPTRAAQVLLYRRWGRLVAGSGTPALGCLQTARPGRGRRQ
nr:hypothetical protein [Tanacetum cinerariifolium]